MIRLSWPQSSVCRAPLLTTTNRSSAAVRIGGGMRLRSDWCQIFRACHPMRASRWESCRRPSRPCRQLPPPRHDMQQHQSDGYWSRRQNMRRPISRGQCLRLSPVHTPETRVPHPHQPDMQPLCPCSLSPLLRHRRDHCEDAWCIAIPATGRVMAAHALRRIAMHAPWRRPSGARHLPLSTRGSPERRVVRDCVLACENSSVEILQKIVSELKKETRPRARQSCCSRGYWPRPSPPRYAA